MLRRVAQAILIATALCALVTPPVRGQAWVKAAGEYYFKVSGSYFETDESYDSAGDKRPISFGLDDRRDTTFRDVTFEAYAEYGLTDYFTLVANLPFKIVTTDEIRSAGGAFEDQRVELTNGGLSDLTLLLRTPLLRRPLALAVQAGVKIPLGYEQEPDNGGPQLGTGEFDGEFHATAGFSLYPIPAYLSGGGGYRLRGGEVFDDQVLYNIEGGYMWGRLFVKVRLDGVLNNGDIHDPTPPMMTPDDAEPFGGNDPNASNHDVLKLIPVVSYAFSPTFALGGELYHVLAGKNITAGTTFVLSSVFTR